MSINNIPFYIYWETYVNFVNTNFSSLILSDDSLFLGFIILNCFFIYCIVLLVKIIKFVVLLVKNIIYK